MKRLGRLALAGVLVAGLWSLYGLSRVGDLVGYTPAAERWWKRVVLTSRAIVIRGGAVDV